MLREVICNEHSALFSELLHVTFVIIMDFNISTNIR